MDVKRHNGNVLPKKPRTLVRGFLIFRGYACCATKTGKSPSSNNPASDIRNASCTVTPATIQHPTSATLPAQRLRQQPCIRRPQRGAAEAHGIINRHCSNRSGIALNHRIG